MNLPKQSSAPADLTRPGVQGMPDERRTHRRMPCKGLAEVRFLESEMRLHGTLFDLTVAGCCIEMPDPLPEFKEAIVEVHLSVNGVRLRIAGVLRNVRRQRRAGIEFTEVSSRKAEQIRQLVREVARRRLGLG